MTIQQAIRARLRIEPGRKVRTFGGWCRRDRVLLDGYEIGKIQTRRGGRRTEVVTIAASGFVPGHNVDWLVLPCREVSRVLVDRKIYPARLMIVYAGVSVARRRGDR